MRVRAQSREETASMAEAFLATLMPSAKATVVAMEGDLGAGKTTFTQGLAWALGVEEVVTSPTFVIEKIYKLPARSMDEGQNASFKHLIHIDCYRLETPNELLHLGFKDLLTDPGNLIVIEWPEKVRGLLPENVVVVEMKFIDESVREISYAD